MASLGSPLVLVAADILRRPGAERTIDLTRTAAELGIHDERIPAAAPIRALLHLETLTDGVVADGTLTVPWIGTCRRCTQPSSGVAELAIHELYQTNVTDPDAFPIDDDRLDLTPMIREAAVLDIPSNPVCRDDCAGLCPMCGVDRNTHPCSCQAPAAENRWSALDQLSGLIP